MTNITVEKIDNIITKIEENSSKGLKDKEARKLLTVIDEIFVEIEKNAEEKQKGIVISKVREFRKEIDKSLSESWGWGRIKTFLNDDVKDDLGELKGKLEELEKPIPIIVTEHKEENKVINFYGKQIEELKVKLEKAEKERDDYKSKLEEKDREVWELKNKKGDFGKEVAREAHDYITSAADTGVRLGHHALPVIGDAIGGLIGTGVGGIGALIHSGNYTAEQVKDLLKDYGEGLKETAEKGMDLTDEARKGLKEFSENVLSIAADVHKDNLHVVADNVEKARQGAENLIGKGMDNVADTLQKIIGTKVQFKLGALNVELGDRKGDVLGATVEGKDEVIKNLKEELEGKKQELENKDKRIKELEMAASKSAEKNQEVQQSIFDKTLNAIVEVAGKSRDNSRAPSRASTPPPVYNDGKQ